MDNPLMLVKPDGTPDFINQYLETVIDWLQNNPSRSVEVLVNTGATWVNALMDSDNLGALEGKEILIENGPNWINALVDFPIGGEYGIYYFRNLHKSKKICNTCKCNYIVI